ncbi:MAG: 30S ribosomal protein S11 [Candidatus Saccharimonadales bacterium]
MAKPATKSTKTVRKKNTKRNIAEGQLHIQSTFNNTIITFTDTKGQVLTWSSAGSSGFRGSRKGTAFAAQIAGEKAAEKAKEYGIKAVDVFVKGIGSGRDSALRSLANFDIQVKSITDVTGVPHNGCRPRKQRRA